MISSVLEGLPSASDRRLAVRVRPAALRQIRHGHPWVFSDSITSVSFDGAPGDLAVVFDDDRNFVAIGLWDPESPIALRVLHQGAPQPIDSAFWQARIDAALERRRSIPSEASSALFTNGYRVINGEGDGFSGLVVDRYDDVGVIKIYSTAWVPWLRVVVELLVARLGLASVVVRVSRNRAEELAAWGLVDGAVVDGDDPPQPVWFSENGLAFAADVIEGQKTGYFLDQRDNRQRVRELSGVAAGGSVLDVFSCSGGFSVYAAAGGARRIVSVDQSRPALAAAAANMTANIASGVIDAAAVEHRVVAGDAFEVMANMAGRGERFDVVIVDPPAFASRQRDIGRALKAYRRLTRAALRLVAPGGTLVQASCSSRVSTEAFVDAIHDEAERLDVVLRDVAVHGHAVDHPTVTAEGEYLKAIFTTSKPRLR